MDNKTLGLKYYADMNDAPVTDLLRKASIKKENHLMAFSDFSWQDCPDHRRVLPVLRYAINMVIYHYPLIGIILMVLLLSVN